MEEKYRQIIEVEIKGLRPLLQNDSFEEDSGGTKKGQVYDPQEEAEKRLILDGDDTICQKSSHLEASMVRSAVEFKFSGRKTYKDLFNAGITVEPLFIPHLNPKWVIDSRSVKIGQARVMRQRPRFDDWGLRFKIINTDNRIQSLIINQVLENAGQSFGIGDYHPKFGLFEVVKFEVVSDSTKKKKRNNISI